MNFTKKYLDMLQTPCFVYDLRKIDAKIKAIREAFSKYPNFELLYAIKANNNDGVVKFCIKNNLGIHVSSKEELELAISLRAKKISYTATIIPREIIKLQHKYKFEINLNNRTDFKLFSSSESELGLRINPLIGWAYLPETNAGGIGSQFGVPINELEKNLPKQITTLHCHTSSDSYKYNIFFKQLKLLLNVAQKNPQINTINLGGGIAVALGKGEKNFDINKFSNTIIKILKKFNKKQSRNIKLQLEFGNFLVRESGYYICEVIQIDKKFGKNYIYTNGTKQHLRGLANLTTTVSDISGTESYVVGCTCQRGDILIGNKKLPIPKIKEKLIFPKVGAYCNVQASNFHMLPKPKEYIAG